MHIIKHRDSLKDILNSELSNLKSDLFSRRLPIKISKSEIEKIKDNFPELDPYNSHILDCKWKSEAKFKERVNEYANEANDDEFSKRLAIECIDIILFFDKKAEEVINSYRNSKSKKIEVID